ncbi:mitochondrial substrate carrier family protein C [Dendrobium catenatum]|uniref:mitochondrial substrate carrier family protein C n=1 Tax=Dendrobium catenatum TaxID=906689 RepID=UPI0009F4D234|nr:mitochondrial substrate carrier family protein C [Dendrobium catenatum]
MASIAEPLESFLNDRFHAVGVALSPIESGVRRAVMDLESRFLDSRNALRRNELKKKPPGVVASSVITDGEGKICLKKGFGGCGKIVGRMNSEEEEGSCSSCLGFDDAWSIFSGRLPFKSSKKCCQNYETLPSKFGRKELKCEMGSLSADKTTVSDAKKAEAFWLERSLCLALEAFVSSFKEFNHRIRGIGGERNDQSGTFKPLASHVDFLKIIKGRKEDFDGFLSNIRFAKVGLHSGFVGEHSSVKEECDFCGLSGNKEEPTSVVVQPKFRNALISIPLSNVERLKSTLSTLSIGELIELVLQLGRTSKDHPDKKKLFSVQHFFQYTEAEGRRFFEELDRDRDGHVTLEDLEIAMRKRRLPKKYAREFFRRTRGHLFSKSIGWKQFLSLMDQREPTILRAYTTLCLSKSGTLQRNQILTSLRSAGLPANENNAVAMMRYLNADKEGSISYSHFRNFMLLLPRERLQDDPRSIWFEAATVFPVSPPVDLATENVLKSALAGGLACAMSTSIMHPLDTMKTRVQASTLSFPELLARLPQIGLQGLYRGSIPAILGQFSSHGLRTGIFEASKLLLTNVAPTLPEIQVQSMASFCSTLLGTAVRIPCEVLKQRLQAGLFDNVGEAIVGTLHQDGIKGFFRGTGATLCREVPFYVAGMGLYAEAKKTAQNLLRRNLEPWETILVGALSGGLAAIVTTPFDVMKTRMMTSTPGLPVSMQAVAFTVLRQEGPLGLFKGAVPRFFWIAPLGAMNFAGYELARKSMDRTDECKATNSSSQLQKRMA